MTVTELEQRLAVLEARLKDPTEPDLDDDAMTRREGAWEAIDLFRQIVDNYDLCEAFKSWFGALYIEGDDVFRNVLVTFVLEHIFERQDARTRFANWQVHPILRQAYREACEWCDNPS